MRRLRLERREELGGGLIGHLLEGERFIAYTLERLWMDNIPYKSCVPCGDYLCQYEYSGKFNRPLYELRDVPGRSECKFHVANYAHQLEGCIGLGLMLGDVDIPIKASALAINKLHERMREREFKLEIRMADAYIPEPHRLIGEL